MNTDRQQPRAIEAARAVNERASKRVVEAQGLAWTVLELGHGDKTLVFLPGALGTVDIFSKQLLHFSRACRVIVLGYPGVADRAAMTASFHALLPMLGIGRAHFIGSSLGAYWLQVFTHERHDVVDSLVLGNTFVDAEPLQGNPLFRRSFLDDSSAAQVKEAWIAFLNGLPASELREFQLAHVGPFQPADELRGRLLTVARSGAVPLSSVPADRLTILTCDDDAITHGPMGEALTAAYPGARHVRLPTGGHYPHVTNPDAYNAAVASACGLKG